MSKGYAGGLGIEGRKKLSQKYQDECMVHHRINGKEGVEVTHNGFVYLWNGDLVMEPNRLQVGATEAHLKYNATIIETVRSMLSGMHEDVHMLFRKDYKYGEFMLKNKYGDEEKTTAEWNAIRSEMEFWKWKTKSLPIEVEEESNDTDEKDRVPPANDPINW